VGEYYFPDTAGREFLYPKWHISIEEQIVVLFRKGTLTEWESKGVKALTGKTVGWIRGYEFDKKDWLDVQINVHELRTLSQGIRMLAARRIDALIDYRSTIVEEGEKAGIPVKDEYDIKPVGRMGQKLFLKFANTKRSETFIKIFDERMTQLAKSGEIEKLYKKWGLSESKFGIDRYGK
ncbi:MAG: amino acid ABC transporter substrate-binding protein, partial [Desulfobacteraceae bacterium]|nr:amino acid ABC transporter substrate-binding protein [Desulfobacteraceae bacterium]